MGCIFGTVDQAVPGLLWATLVVVPFRGYTLYFALITVDGFGLFAPKPFKAIGALERLGEPPDVLSVAIATPVQAD